MQSIKCVVVGDISVGKTSLLTACITTAFPGVTAPFLFDYTSTIMIDGKPLNLSLWDTSGRNDRLRPLAYPGTDVILICFAINQRQSFDNLAHVWVPEIRRHCPTTPYFFIGCKSDLRNGALSPDEGLAGSILITYEEALDRQKELGAYKYMEWYDQLAGSSSDVLIHPLSSAVTNEGIKELFEEVIRVELAPNAKNPPPPLPPKPAAPSVPVKELTNARFATLVNKKEFSDVTFKVQDKELSAHKVILSAASPMFQKIFVGGATELPPMFTLTKSSSTEQSEHGQADREKVDWKREEHVTIEVKDFSVRAFNVILLSCYAMVAPKGVMSFFQKYPRFKPNEQRAFLYNLAQVEADQRTLADVCVILPSGLRQFCHKAILASGSDYFRSLLADTEQNCTIHLDLTDTQFDSLRRFLYTAEAPHAHPNSFFQDFLPKLVQMKMHEYVSYCVRHLCDAVSEEDKSDQFGYVLSVLNLANELDLRQLHNYCIWWMQINFETIRENKWFKNDMSSNDREEIVRGQYPGPEYHQTLAEWRAANKKGKKKDKDCVLQ